MLRATKAKENNKYTIFFGDKDSKIQKKRLHFTQASLWQNQLSP
jgi:hypothetical protein